MLKRKNRPEARTGFQGPDQNRRKAKEVERTFGLALKMLARKACSEREIRGFLESRSFDQDEIEETIRRLRNVCYIDDERFAYSFGSYRVQQKGLGRRRLERELEMRKVSRETTEAAIALIYQETPEAQLVDRAIAKRARTRGEPTSAAGLKRLISYLLRLGFDYELIKERLSSLRQREEESEINKRGLELRGTLQVEHPDVPGSVPESIEDLFKTEEILENSKD